MFYWWHMPTEKLAKMYPENSNKFWKCKETEGTYHMRWTCNKAKKCWKKVHEILQKMLKCVIPFKPETFLLNIIPK